MVTGGMMSATNYRSSHSNGSTRTVTDTVTTQLALSRMHVQESQGTQRLTDTVASIRMAMECRTKAMHSRTTPLELKTRMGMVLMISKMTA
jgi:hypothetical protein